LSSMLSKQDVMAKAEFPKYLQSRLRYVIGGCPLSPVFMLFLFVCARLVLVPRPDQARAGVESPLSICRLLFFSVPSVCLYAAPLLIFGVIGPQSPSACLCAAPPLYLGVIRP
jgi:hypothetical protein